MFSAALLLAGCAQINVVQKKPDGSQIMFHGFSLFSNSAFKNLGVDSTTKTTSNLLKVSTGNTEPNPEAITATGDALGAMIGRAAREAAGLPK